MASFEQGLGAQSVKTLIKNAAYHPFLNQLLLSPAVVGWALDDATVVLLYHEVSDAPSVFHQQYGLNVRPSIFEKQIRAMKENFYLASPHDLVSGKYKKPAVLVTFDDGAAGYFENAVPILKKYECPSLIFLNMGPILGEIFWSGLVTYLCTYDADFMATIRGEHRLKEPAHLYIRPEWVEAYLGRRNREEIFAKARTFYGNFAQPAHLEACRDDRLVFFGNHLYNHYNCGASSLDEIKENFIKNRRIIERYPNATQFYSYPFGQEGSCYNTATTGLLRSLGAQAIFTAQPFSFKKTGDMFHRLPMDERVCSPEDLKKYIVIKRLRQMLGRMK